MSFLTRRPGRRTTVVAAIALAGGMFIGYAGAPFAGDGLPADKTAVGGSAVQDIDPSTTHEILHQRMKVSSPADLILGVTSECTILTRLLTNTATKDAETTGSVVLHIDIDNRTVPVQTVGFDNDNDGEVEEGEGQDDGSVTFCNRTYQRSVSDNEGDALGRVDQQQDYIRTKTANAFNWVALDVGVDRSAGGYDDPVLNGNNIIDIRVYATYVGGRQESACVAGTTCSTAYVGKRTLVIEPVHAAVFEQSEPSNTTTTAAVTDLIP
ncbi:MAG TPA: hypothetical protein VHF47_10560 [Acidimicrobiales bacterium]|nr:hypothetical protein [Acidimicrobiales bacterium]